MKRVRLLLILLLSVALAACGKPEAGDNVAPKVVITSHETSATATYTLEGHAWDEKGVTSASYTLNGGSATSMPLASGGTFSASLTLSSGDNTVEVTATDAKGNEGKASLTITYLAQPGSVALSPMVAARGETVTVSGTDFADAGSLTVGGVEADIQTWSDTQITATLSATTPHGWQDVVVGTANGDTTFSGFFVGTEFTGDADGLQEFLDGLPKGTATLLQAETYDFTGNPEHIFIDNHSLYGRGESETMLITDAGGGVMVFVDYEQDVTVADLGIQTDLMYYGAGTLGGVSALSVAVDPFTLDVSYRDVKIPLTSDLTIATRGVHAEARAGYRNGLAALAELSLRVPDLGFEEFGALEPQAVGAPALTFRSVTFEEIAGGAFGFPLVPSIVGEVLFENSTVVGPNSIFYPLASQALRISGSSIDVGVVMAASISGTVTVSDSHLETEEELLVGAELGALIEDSVLRSRDAGVELFGFLDPLGIPGVFGGPVVVKRSVLDAPDGDLTDGNPTGSIIVLARYAPITLEENTSITAASAVVIQSDGAYLGSGGVTLRNNQEITVGLFEAEYPGNARDGFFVVAAGPDPELVGNTVTLEGNTINSSGALMVEAGSGGTVGHIVATNNTFLAGDGYDDGHIRLYVDTGTLSADGNSFAADDSVWVYADDLSGGLARFSDNEISVTGDDSPWFEINAYAGACEVSGNTVRVEDLSGDDSAWAYLECATADPAGTTVVSGNELRVIGNGFSGVWTGLYGPGEARFVSNSVFGEGYADFDVLDGSATVSSNDFHLVTGGLYFWGSSDTDLTVVDNAVVQDGADDFGLFLDGVGTTSVLGNTFADEGAPSGLTTALVVYTDGDEIELTATSNTFRGYVNALYLWDEPVTAHGINAQINRNVFDFLIDAAPKVAELVNVGTIIDAADNVWGSNTDLATVEGYVLLGGDTAAQGGGIDLDPIRLP